VLFGCRPMRYTVYCILYTVYATQSIENTYLKDGSVREMSQSSDGVYVCGRVYSNVIGTDHRRHSMKNASA